MNAAVTSSGMSLYACGCNRHSPVNTNTICCGDAPRAAPAPDPDPDPDAADPGPDPGPDASEVAGVLKVTLCSAQAMHMMGSLEGLTDLSFWSCGAICASHGHMA